MRVIRFRTGCLHISGVFKKTAEPDIEETNPDIGTKKPTLKLQTRTLRKNFRPKQQITFSDSARRFPGETIFGRSDVMKTLGLKTSRTSELLGKLAERGIIEPVSGYGKGKYRFR